MIYAAILAGGTGTRMGGEKPKQFLSVGGVPVIVRSVRAFLHCGMVFGGVYVAAAAGYVEYTQSLMDTSFGTGRVIVVEGGADRSGSIMKIIEAVLQNGGTDDDILITHDAARPFVSGDIICRNIEDTAQTGCAGTAVTAVDTIFRSEKGELIEEMPPRSEMYQMQTPQGFGIGRYVSCFNALSDKEKTIVTDACGVFLRAGHPVKITEGDHRNIKITRPVDLALGEHIAAQLDSEEK